MAWIHAVHAVFVVRQHAYSYCIGLIRTCFLNNVGVSTTEVAWAVQWIRRVNRWFECSLFMCLNSSTSWSLWIYSECKNKVNDIYLHLSWHFSVCRGKSSTYFLKGQKPLHNIFHCIEWIPSDVIQLLCLPCLTPKKKTTVLNLFSILKYCFLFYFPFFTENRGIISFIISTT